MKNFLRTSARRQAICFRYFIFNSGTNSSPNPHCGRLEAQSLFTVNLVSVGKQYIPVKIGKVREELKEIEKENTCKK